MLICPHCQTVNHAQNAACTNCGAPLVPNPALDGDPFIGRQLSGRFTLQSIVGSGELGMVYRGIDQKTGQQVAVKLVHPDVASTHGDELLRSARMVAKLRHAKIAAVLGASREADGTTFIVTEFLRGETLKSLLGRSGPLGPRRAADILFQLCSALAPMHRVGRPHANLKPENVFLVEKSDGSDFVKVVDAGSPDLFGVKDVLGGNIVIGTPKYFSPEQATGQAVGLTSDQFTLGIIGYQLLTGALPFFGATPTQLLEAIANGQPTPVSQRVSGVALPERLAGVIHRCLNKNPAERFPDLRALATELAGVIKSTQAAPVRKQPFDRNRDMSTMIAQVSDIGSDLFGDEDEDRTVMRSAPEELMGVLTGNSSPGDRTIARPISDDLLSALQTPPTSMQTPEPLMFTGTLGGSDLSAALASAVESVGAPAVAPPKPVTPSSRPVAPPPPRVTPPPVSTGNFDDLASALASAAESVGAPAEGGFDPFGADEKANAPASSQPLASEPASSAPSSSALGNELFDSIAGDLGGPNMSEPPAAIAAPLASAIDFAAIHPDSSDPLPPPPANSSSSKMPIIIGLITTLAVVGGAVWWFVIREEPAAKPKTQIARKKIIKKKAAAEKAVAEKTTKESEVPTKEAAIADGQAETFDPEVVVRVTTDPEGAQLIDRDTKKVLGETPLTLTFKKAGKRNYVVHRSAFKDVEYTFDPVDYNTGAPKLKSFKLERIPVDALAKGPKTKPKDDEGKAKTPKKKPPRKKPPRKKKPRKKKPNVNKIRDPFAD